MAEWAPTAPTPPSDYPHEIETPPPSLLPPRPARSKPRSRPPSSPPPIHQSEKAPPFQPRTYVVQVPKEQIFRTPPPENAQLAEEYRQKLRNREQRYPSCHGCLGRSLLILLIAVFIAVLAIGVFFLVVRPGIPSFSVESLSSKQMHGRAREEFNLKLWSHNPSLKMAYCFDAGGNAALSHNGKDIASGKTPGFCQPAKSSSTLKLEMEGLDANLPKKSSSILLVIQFPVRLKVGGMQVWSSTMSITCDIRLDELGTTTKTGNIWEGCRSKMHWIRI